MRLCCQACDVNILHRLFLHSTGAAGVLVGHPLDTIKTWQQTTNVGVGRAMFKIIVRNDGVNYLSAHIAHFIIIMSHLNQL